MREFHIALAIFLFGVCLCDRPVLIIHHDAENLVPERFLNKLLDTCSDDALLEFKVERVGCRTFNTTDGRSLESNRAHMVLTTADYICSEQEPVPNFDPHTTSQPLFLVVTPDSYERVLPGKSFTSGLETNDVLSLVTHSLRVFRDAHVPRLHLQEHIAVATESPVTRRADMPMYGVLILGIIIIALVVVAAVMAMQASEAKKKAKEYERRMTTAETRRQDQLKAANKKAEKGPGDPSSASSKVGTTSASSKSASNQSSTKTAGKGTARKYPKAVAKNRSDERLACKNRSDIENVCKKKKDSVGNSDFARSTLSKTNDDDKTYKCEDILKYRTMTQKIQEIYTPNEFSVGLSMVGEFVINYFATPTYYDVTSNFAPGVLISTVAEKPPVNPECVISILSDVRAIILKGMSHNQHPRFHSHPTNGRTFASVLTDCLVSGIGAADFENSLARVEIEVCVVNWYAKALGLPECFLFNGLITGSHGGGTIMESGTDTILTSMVVAKNWKLQQIRYKVQGSGVTFDEFEYSTKLVCYGSTTNAILSKLNRPSIQKCHLIHPNAPDFVVNGEKLEEQIKKDIAAGLIPTYAVCTIGSSITFTSDDVQTMAEVCKKYNIWLHVDATSFGVTWIDPKYRPNALNNGLQSAMSIAVNSPRCILHDASPAFYWTRDQQAHRAGIATSDHMMGTWTLRGPNTFRALKVWMEMRIYGINGLRSYINHLMDLTAYMEVLILKNKKMRKFGNHKANVCCVQYANEKMSIPEVNQHTENLARFVNKTHLLSVGLSEFGGHTFICLFVAHEKASVAEVDTSVKIFNDLLEKYSMQTKEEQHQSRAREVNELVFPYTKEDTTTPKPVTKESLPNVLKIVDGAKSPIAHTPPIESATTGRVNSATNVTTAKNGSTTTGRSGSATNVVTAPTESPATQTPTVSASAMTAKANTPNLVTPDATNTAVPGSPVATTPTTAIPEGFDVPPSK